MIWHLLLDCSDARRLAWQAATRGHAVLIRASRAYMTLTDGPRHGTYH